MITSSTYPGVFPEQIEGSHPVIGVSLGERIPPDPDPLEVGYACESRRLRWVRELIVLNVKLLPKRVTAPPQLANAGDFLSD